MNIDYLWILQDCFLCSVFLAGVANGILLLRNRHQAGLFYIFGFLFFAISIIPDFVLWRILFNNTDLPYQTAQILYICINAPSILVGTALIIFASRVREIKSTDS